MNHYRSPKETAQALGVCTKTLRRWRATGEGPAFTKLGPRRIAYAQVELDAWLAARTRQQNTADAPPPGPQSGMSGAPALEQTCA